MRISFLMLVIIGTASYNFTVVFPLFVEHGLHGDNTDYTLLYSAFSAGAVIGTLLVARRRNITTRSLTGGAALLGLSMTVLAVTPDLTVAYPLAGLVGAASVTYMTATTALAQLQANRQMVGRVLALQTVLMLGTTPIGGPILGVVADAAGGRVPVLIGGIAALVAATLGTVFSRRQSAAILPLPAATAPGGE